MPHKVVVLNGVSGAGKSTLYAHAMQDPQVKERFGFSVSYTTRQPREGEVDGVHYNFVSVERFQEMIAEGAFVEHTQVHGNYYGTAFAMLQRALRDKHVILDIDYKGLLALRGSEKFDAPLLSILIKPPTPDSFRERLLARGTETPEQVQKRVETAQAEMRFYGEHADLYNIELVNDDLELASQRLIGILLGFTDE